MATAKLKGSDKRGTGRKNLRYREVNTLKEIGKLRSIDFFFFFFERTGRSVGQTVSLYCPPVCACVCGFLNTEMVH